MRYFLFIITIIGLYSCKKDKKAESIPISAGQLIKHVEVLASDSFMGRQPATAGGRYTTEYISGEFGKMGIVPGNGDRYLQEVPMVAITAAEVSPMRIHGARGELQFEYGPDFVAGGRQVRDAVELRGSEMVFAGFGIVAPEYNWNDYEGLDVKGKTVVVLVNDPGFGSGNEDIFKDEAMTYYGRWSYKYEEAARQGAAAVLIIHEDSPASYGWQVVENSWSGTQLYLFSPDSNRGSLAAEGWISLDAAQKLFAAAGMENYRFREEARKPGFQSFALPLTMDLSFKNTIATSESNNVIGLIKGKTRPEEYIVYTAHWDHLGVGRPVNGDSIFNGAVDNATGVAAVMEIGRAFAEAEEAPDRSIILLLVTGEESGLLGSQYYAEHPVYPLSKTVANINMDALYPFARWKDVTVVGYGQSEMDDIADTVAQNMGRYVQANPHPEAGYFYRSDHFNFAKMGVPAFYAKGSTEDMEKGREYGEKMYRYYRDSLYHQVTDEYDPERWNLEGLAGEAEFMFRMGRALAYSDFWPHWKAGSEFKKIREESLDK